ncbi:pisatin demethylase [Diplogelasinospora grovesii]|uniref:Cytochrome P450 monooxygenase ABA1 n=1 Tax=Diplogelasinospora grovesii TaxID=303347 RepID=A0AAN6S3R2_9PEZI|nr:pisatin demethylase [Diplogelasinospora grovesii]
MALLANIYNQVYKQRAPLLVGAFIIYALHKLRVYLRLRNCKGPFGVGFTELPHTWNFLGPACHEWYRDVNEKYGPIARIGPNSLVTSSPDVWAHVNVKPGYKRSDWYYKAVRIEHRKDNVFSQTDNEKHDKRRKQIAPGYSGRENSDLESAIDARLSDFIRLIQSKYLSKPDSRVVPMDLAKKIQFLTLDVISTVGLGKSFGMLAADQDVDDYLKSSEEGLLLGNTVLALGLSNIAHIAYLGQLISPSVKDKTGFGKMMATCFRYVDERAADPTDSRTDMLASFIRHGLEGDELRSEALEQVLAGSDTTASALRGAMLYLMTHPRVCDKLQAEIDSRVPGDGIASASLTREMPYLQAVIREALRVWPPVVNIFPRDVPPGGDTVIVSGKRLYLPEGVNIGYSGYAMHHSKEIYGEDAKAFRPERWFEQDQEKLAAMTRTNDLVFGHGRFQCLGKNVARIEIEKTLFELLRRFDWALANPAEPWRTRNVMGLFAISDMWVQVTERRR